MAAPGVTWLGQARTVVAVPDESLAGSWTRSEKILALGVLVNVTYLIYEILRRQRNVDLAGPGF
jgi:hypothetical protein